MMIIEYDRLLYRLNHPTVCSTTLNICSIKFNIHINAAVILIKLNILLDNVYVYFRYFKHST